MKLEHLTPAQAAIFRVIRQHGEISRARIIDTLCRKGPHKMPEGTISSGLSRLEGFGFVARPDVANAVDGWRLTPEGAALFGDAEGEGVDPPRPEPQPEPETAGEMAARLGALAETAVPAFGDGPADHGETLADLARAPAGASIVDQHLAFVRAQLTAPIHIPGDAARVYREIIQVLPLSLVEVLLPITKLVESRS